MTSRVYGLPSTWPLVHLRDVSTVRYGSALPASLRNEKGGILVIGSAGKSGFHDLAYHHKPSIVIGRKGSVGSVTYVAVPFWPIDTVFFLDDVSPYLDLRFLAAALEYFGLDRYKIVVGVPGINRSDLERFQFPMPPLTEQRQIVEILHEAEELRRLRSKAETVTGALSSAIFDEMFGSPSAWKGGPKLGDIVRIVGGGTPTKSVEHFYSGAIPWATSKDIKRLYLDDTEDHVTEEAVQSSATNIVPPKTVLVVVKSKILAHSLPMAITNVPMCFGQDLKGLVPNPGVTPEFIVHSLQAQARRVLSRARGANTEGLTLEALKSLTVPNPADPAMRRFAATCEEIGALGKTALAANRLQSLTSASLLAHLFSGQITAAWRKKHGHQLAREAGERDARLRESAHELPPLQAVTVQDWDRFLQMPTDGIYADLNREQRQLLRDIERMVGGALYARYFSARHLGDYLAHGTLHRNPHLIESHLAVLAARGLIIPVSLEKQTEDTGEFVFGNAYRLPLARYEPIVAGDSSRLLELERLAAQLEKERMPP